MMPSLWKKQKGNRISRLVADLQTTPKRGGSLVVETGFPTSLIDLFVKNRDKLKKPKTKKHKSKKKVITFSQDEDVLVIDNVNNNNINNIFDDENDIDLPNLPSVSSSSNSLSDLELPICSIDQKNDAQIHEFVGNNVVYDGSKGVSKRRNLVLFSVLVGVLVLIVVLYTKRWFLAFVALGFVVLLLLECVGRNRNRNRNRNDVLRLFKPCGSVISMPVLKGGLAVVVALYTKWFVVGITMGASLLILLEYAGNSGFGIGLFKPSRGEQWDLKGVLSQLGAWKQRRRNDQRGGRKRGVLTRSGVIASKRVIQNEVESDGVSSGDFDQGEFGDEGVLIEEIETCVGNDFTSKMGTNLSIEGDVVASKGVVTEPGNGCYTYVSDESWLVKEDSRNKPMYEHIAFESNMSKKRRASGSSGPIVLKRDFREKGSEDSKIVSHNGKSKKGKKFWKKLVPKKKNKKSKHKRGKGNDCTQDAEVELEEEDEGEEGEQEISEGEGSSSMSSSEEDDVAVDNSCVSYTQMLETDNRTTACGPIKGRSEKSKYIGIMMIPLTGLIGGRLFAVVLTVICCLVFKMVRG